MGRDSCLQLWWEDSDWIHLLPSKKKRNKKTRKLDKIYETKFARL